MSTGRSGGLGPDGAWGSADDDYGDLRLRPGSPCINSGKTDAVPADAADLDHDGDVSERVPFDLSAGPRVVDCVEMGAYEYQGACGTPDGDADAVCDGCDNCVTVFNPNQADADNDAFGDPELLTCLTLEVTALGAAAHTSESGNVEIPLLELPLADGNSRQLCLHLNSEPAVQEMPCFTGYVGSRSGVLEPGRCASTAEMGPHGGWAS